MILLWGIADDGPLDAVRGQLRRLGADYRLLDQADAADRRAIVQVEGGHLSVVIEGPRDTDRLKLDQVHAAYLRPVQTLQALGAARAAQPTVLQRAEQVDRALITWADLSPARVLNPPWAMAANNTKPFQLRQIARHGFAVPATLVTTEPDAVRAFAARHGRVIYKSVSGVRSVVHGLDDAGLARLDDVANAPTQFQQHVPGHDVRVHVVGDELFATEVRSAAADYRYASLSGNDVAMRETQLPARVAERCRRMAAGMGLPLAGIDLRRTPRGQWFCFEVNPSPAFVYYEEATGQAIGEAIARLLAS